MPRFFSLAHRSLVASLGLLTLLSSCQRPIPAAAARDAIAATVNAFHTALENGEPAAAMALLAEDAQVLEMGVRETREQYSGEHLTADMRFAKAVSSTRSAMVVRQEGPVAWTTQQSRTEGRFMSRDVNADGTELMVLAKTPDGWRIRAIHWSSHSHAPPAP